MLTDNSLVRQNSWQILTIRRQWHRLFLWIAAYFGDVHQTSHQLLLLAALALALDQTRLIW